MPVEGRGAVDQVVTVEDPAGQRLHQLGAAPQRLADPAAEVLRVEPQLVGLRVDRGDLQPVGLVEQVDLRVGQLQAPPVLGDLAEEHRLGALGELAGPPRLVEERDAEVAGPVGDPQLGAGLAAAAARNGGGGRHATEDPRRLVDARVPDRGLLRLVEVAARVVREQVEDRGDLDLGQDLGPLRADALEHGDRQVVELSEPLRQRRATRCRRGTGTAAGRRGGPRAPRPAGARPATR